MAAGPHGAKTNTGGDHSTDHGEPQWRTNSSFSPPPLQTWDCRLQSDGLPHGSYGAPEHGSSFSLNSKGNRSGVDSDDRYANHHHSVSDGALSYSGSPPDNYQAPRWTSPMLKFNLGEFATSSMGGSRSEAFWLPHSNERRYTARASATSHSFGSPSSLPESCQWELSTKQSLSLPNRNSSGRRSFMSKPVYPLVFRNPVSDCEAFGDAERPSLGRLTPSDDQIPPSHWPDSNSSTEHKFHRSLTELQKLETSPDPSASSRREGFRWSSASSFDMGFDGETFDMAEHMDVESQRSPVCPVGDQRCGICGKLLWQKSPWSSHRIMRGSDMPIAGILPCSHVFHAECLEQMTPKAQIHDPPCPMCLKTIGTLEESPAVSEPLQMALRTVRRSRGVVISGGQGNHRNDEASCNDNDKESVRRKWLWTVPRPNGGSGSLLKNHLKKHFKFKGKMGQDFFNRKVFCRNGNGASSSTSVQ